MTHSFRTAAAVLFGVGVLTVAAPAGALPAVQDVTGVWQGFSMSSLTGEITMVRGMVDFQDNRRFGGEMLGMSFDGTVAANNRFNVVGLGGPDTKFVSNGQLMPCDDGLMDARGDYRSWTPAGKDQGSLFLLQSFHARNAPLLDNHWQGTFTAGEMAGDVDVMIDGQDGSSFHGRAMIGRMFFPFVGSVGDPNTGGEAPIHAIGLTAEVSFELEGSVVMGPQPHLRASFTAMYPDASELGGTFELTPVR